LATTFSGSAESAALFNAAYRRSVMQQGPGTMLPADAFIANEAHWFTLDVIYLVFVRNGAIAAARVGGQLLGRSGNYPAEPSYYAKPKLLLRWAGAEPSEPDFLNSDRKNFRYSTAELREVVFKPRRALWTGGIPNSGSVILYPRSGRRRRLILLGDQNLQAIFTLMQANGAPVSPPAA
jgi:hypothetical protein